MEAMASATSLKWLLLAAVTNTKSAILSGVRGWKESLGGMKVRRTSSLALNGMVLLAYCSGSFSETCAAIPPRVEMSVAFRIATFASLCDAENTFLSAGPFNTDVLAGSRRAAG